MPPPPCSLARLALVTTITVLAVAAAACSDANGDAGDDLPATTTSPPAGSLERYGGFTSEIYADPAHWLCRPDAVDVCDADLDATAVDADGSLTPEPFVAAEDPPVDCFYVYPTISRDPGPNSDLSAADDEEGFAALNQVARLSSQCRVFAPTYRQITLGALAVALGDPGGGDTPGGFELAIADVDEAWRHYMANDNGGRGVVLVGHSQGAGILTGLIAEEVDPNPDVRERLVAAYLAGTGVAVPEGEVVGGVFSSVPLCGSTEETGCVVTWSSYRATSPPPEGALFGRAQDAAEGEVAGCVSPATVGGGSAELRPYFPSTPAASILADLGVDEGRSGWVDGSPIDTPFVSLPGLVRAGCVTRDGFSYLEVDVQGDPGDPRADDISGDLTPEWGLHLVDFNLVMGDVVDLVGRQVDAYLSD